jgi:hypothetical protein
MAGAVGAVLASSAASAQAATVDFHSTGAEQLFTVPSGVTSLQVVAIGGRGGTGASAPRPAEASVLSSTATWRCRRVS